MNKLASNFFASVAVIAVAACGGGDEGPNWAGEVDAATATAAGEDAASFAGDLANDLLSGDPTSNVFLVKGTETPNYAETLIAQMRAKAYRRGSNPGMAATPSPFRVSTVCEPTETGVDTLGTPVDTDADGIPDDYRITFPAGCTEISGSGTVTYSGSLRLRDLTGLYAFRLDASNLRIRYQDASGFEQFLFSGFEQGVYASTGIAHSTDMTYALSYQYDDAVVPGPSLVAVVSGAISFVYKENSAYDPDGTITTDAPIPNGNLSFALDYRIIASGEEGAGAFRFTMATTDPLALDNVTCYGPTNGTIVGDLNGDGAVGFTIDWSACNTYTVTTRGTTEPAVVAAR